MTGSAFVPRVPSHVVQIPGKPILVEREPSRRLARLRNSDPGQLPVSRSPGCAGVGKEKLLAINPVLGDGLLTFT